MRIIRVGNKYNIANEEVKTLIGVLLKRWYIILPPSCFIKIIGMLSGDVVFRKNIVFIDVVHEMSCHHVERNFLFIVCADQPVDR